MDRTKLWNSIWYLARPVLIYALVFTAVQAVLYRLLETVLLLIEWDMVIYYAYWESLFTAIIVAIAHSAAVFPLLREAKVQIAWRERKDCWIAHRRDQNILLALMAIGTVCAAIGLNAVLMKFYAAAETDLSGWRLSAAVAVYGFVTPFTEEILFRGLLYGRLRQIVSFAEAALISAAAFGLFHGSLWQALYGFAIGLLLAFAYELTGRFVIPVILHGACNVYVLLITSVGLWPALGEGMWPLFWLTAAAAVIFWFGKRLRETGWDPGKRWGDRSGR